MTNGKMHCAFHTLVAIVQSLSITELEKQRHSLKIKKVVPSAQA